MATKYYRIVIKFNYANGTKGGVTDGVVYGKTGVERQLEHTEWWLAHKGHTEISREISEVEKPS